MAVGAGMGVRAQKFQDRPLGIPSPTGKSSPTVPTLIYYPFGQCPPLPKDLEGLGGLQRVLESLKGPLKALKGPKGVLRASEGFREPQRASMSL